jgi:hypothetical protein
MINPSPLSTAQARFADAHESHEHSPAQAASGCVFMYRERPGRTERWLVARDGTQLEWERLRYP